MLPLAFSIFAPLQWIWEIIRDLGCWILDAIIDAINLVIAGLAAVTQLALDELQIDFPELPGMPANMETAASFISWLLPVGTITAVLAFVIVFQLAWFLVVILLRWIKAAE